MALRDDLTKEIELRLGGQMVDVELDPEHYELSMDKSFEKYRQRSENAVEEAFVKLDRFIFVLLFNSEFCRSCICQISLAFVRAHVFS